MDAQKLMKYFDQKLTSFKQELLDQVASKEDLDQFINRKEFNQFKSVAYDKLDIVIAELKAFREEQAAHTGSHERVNDELLDHETRLRQLESPQPAA